MGVKNFFIWVVKNLIIILLGTLIFSTVALNFPDIVTGIFGDVYKYSSPEAQKDVADKLAETCSSLDHGQNAVTMGQICTNETLLQSMRDNCDSYKQAKEQGMQIENEQQVAETCRQIEPGQLEKSCSQVKNKPAIDFSEIGRLCKEYKSGKIDDKKFFSEFVGIYTGGESSQLPKISVLEKYNAIINYLNNNKFLYFAALLILAVILYLIINDTPLFFAMLAQISFSLGVLIILPYLGILAFQYFVGFDTTPILGGMLGFGSQIDAKAIFSVVLLLFLRTYNNFIITFGIMLLAVGVAGKIYNFKNTKKTSKTQKKNKNVDELFDDLKQDMKKRKK